MRCSSRVMWPLMLGLLGCQGTPAPKEHFGPPEAAANTRDAAAGESETPVVTPPSNESFETQLKAAYASCDVPSASGAFTKQALRRAALSCTGYHLCGMQQASEALTQSVRDHASETSDESQQRAQEAFATVLAIWSRIELMQYGPLGQMASSAGEDMYLGQNLREQLYAWPLVSKCRVDEQVVEQAYRDEGVDAQAASAKGLAALEYLLFAEATRSACSATSDTTAAYDGLADDERERRKLAYAEALSESLSSLSDELVAHYQQDSEFGQAFVSASGYPSGQEALNVLAWGFIYLEREVRDWKLGVHAGETLTAPVDEPEAPHASLSTRAMLENLNGFRAIFQGCGDDGEGHGFDDWLAEAGHASLSDDIMAAFDDAFAKIEALPAAVDAATPGQLEEAYAALYELTTLLKADFFGAGSPINLALPATLEGDTD